VTGVRHVWGRRSGRRTWWDGLSGSRVADALVLTLGRLPTVVQPRRLRRDVEMRRAFREVMRRGSWGWPSRSDTVPPEGERFTVHAVWAVEFYTPAHAEDLIARLHRLGFEEARWSATQSLSDSIRRHRSSLGESWSNLGVITRSGRGPDRVQADLPGA
jgi:hypothetical protein